MEGVSFADHIGDMFALGIGFDPASEPSMRSTIQIAFRLGLSVYNAAYIALAERLDTVLYAADESLLGAAGPRGESIRPTRPSG
jgi:predicted nucleic acid-binding protein